MHLTCGLITENALSNWPGDCMRGYFIQYTITYSVVKMFFVNSLLSTFII